jgi:hypothetical protein
MAQRLDAACHGPHGQAPVEGLKACPWKGLTQLLNDYLGYLSPEAVVS